MLFNGNKLNPFSAEFHRKLRDLNEMSESALRMIRSVQPPPEPAVLTPVKITGSSANSATAAIWKYSGTQQRPRSFTGTTTDWENDDPATAFTDTLINDYEYGNTAILGYGMAIVWSATKYVVNVAGMNANTFAPAPSGLIVWVRPVARPDGTLRWHFSAPPTIIPACT